MDIYHPAENGRLASLLSEHGFSFADRKPFVHADGNSDSGFVFSSQDRAFLVLFPNTGTGIAKYHCKTEEITYVGPVHIPDQFVPANLLACKFQNNGSEERDKAADLVEKLSLGRTFTVVSETRHGRWHGYHNLDPDRPVGIVIARTF